jgi:hypothetical protein
MRRTRRIAAAAVAATFAMSFAVLAVAGTSPAVTSVSPVMLAATGGTVTVTGSGLANVDTVVLGANTLTTHPCPAPDATGCFTVASDSALTLQLGPGGAGTVDVVARVAGRPSATSAADELTVALPAPVITSIVPAVGSSLGGQTVTVRGTDLTPAGGGAVELAFGGLRVAATVNTDGSLSAVTPHSTAGTSPVRVVTQSDDGSVGRSSPVGAVQFTFESPPLTPPAGEVPTGVHFAPLDSAGHGSSVIAVQNSLMYSGASNGSGFAGVGLASALPFYGSRATAFASLDGAGKPASAVAINDNSIWVMRNAGGKLGVPQLWSMTPFYGSLATVMADVDGNGIAAAVAVNANSIWVMRVNSARTGFNPPQLWSLIPFYGNRGTFMAVIDGSHRAAAVAVNDSSVWIMRNDGRSFRAPELAATWTFYGSRSVQVADLDGSGRASLVAVNDGSMWVERNNGNGAFGAPAVLSAEPFSGYWEYFADVDGRGRASAIAVGASGIWVKQNSNGTLGPAANWLSVPFYGSH